jgi:hypothetical protein
MFDVPVHAAKEIVDADYVGLRLTTDRKDAIQGTRSAGNKYSLFEMHLVSLKCASTCQMMLTWRRRQVACGTLPKYDEG